MSKTKHTRDFIVPLNSILLACVAAIFLLTPQIFARQVSIGSVDLPYTAAVQWDTITFSASKITTGGSGIWVKAHNVTIDLRDDTLEFGTNYSDNVYGIYTDYHRKNITILGNPLPNNGGLILHGGGTGVSDSSWDCVNVRTLGGLTEDIDIIDVDMEIYGWDGHNYKHHDGSIRELLISGGKFTTHNDGFTSRCSFDASSIYVNSYGDGGAAPGGIIHDVVFDTWHDGIFFYGKLQIYNCSLFVDAKNDLYWPGDNDDNFCHTSALSAGITAWGPSAGTQIYDNYIEAGINNEGCEQGISMNYAEGTYTDTIKVYRNKAILHRGPDDHYGGITCKGYKQRWGNKYVSVYDNEFYLYAHADSGAHAAAYGRSVEGFEMLWIDAAHGSEGPFIDSFITIRNNHIEAVALSSNTTAVGARLTIRGELTGYNWQNAGNIWKNNYFKSSSIGLDLGKPDGGPCNNFLTVGDTIAVGGEAVDYRTFEVGDWGGPSTNNTARDMTFIGGAIETDITWNSSSNSNGSDLAFERTLQIYVEGNNGLSVVNAACSLWNGAGDFVGSVATNYQGFATPVVKYYHAFKNSTDVNYNDFTIKVEKDGTSGSRDYTVTSSNSLVVLALSIAGTGDSTNIDTIAPGTIDNLQQGPGAEQGSIKLNWIAPGDDYTDPVGTSVYQYAIRWWLADSLIFSGEVFDTIILNPQPYGSAEEFIISNLLPGEEYNITIEAFDEVGNTSGIVGPAISWSRGIRPPTLAGAETDPGSQSAVLSCSTVLSYYGSLDYQFHITDSSTIDTFLMAATILDGLASVTINGLAIESVHSWTSRAIAPGTDSSSWALPYSQFNLSNEAPSVPIVNSPADGSTVTNSAGLELIVDNSSDSDGPSDLTYEFELTENLLLAASGLVQEGAGATAWEIPVPLTSDSTYSWRARSFDGELYSDWTASTSFTVVSAGANVYVYPNPVRFARGETATFLLPDELSDLNIFTSSGQTVIQMNDLQGMWVWDGKNAAGNDIAAGFYLWYVQSGNYVGKLQVIR